MSAAVPCTSNGIKRSATNALLSDTSSTSGGSGLNSSEYFNLDKPTSSQSVSPPPPEKRSFIVIESPLKLETIASAEDLDAKVLKIQNKNLSDRLIQRQKLESELREKINALQSRKITDDNKLCIIDRYWTQLDEDLRLILERFDSNIINEISLESKTSSNNITNNNNNNSNQAFKHFLTKLNDWDKVELEENLKERVKFTTQTVSKLITNYERISKRMEQYFKELYQFKSLNKSDKVERLTSNDAIIDLRSQELHEENCKLNELVSRCQQKSHKFGLELKQSQDQIAKLENELKELTHRNDEIEYDLEKTRNKAFKLDRQLADLLTKQKQMNSNSTSNSNLDQNGTLNKLNQQASRNEIKSNNDKQILDLEADLEEQRELAKSRLIELEKLFAEYQTCLRLIDKLKIDLKQMPESVIEQSSEYKILQTKYSLVVNDNIKLKQVLDESKNLLEVSRATFQRQLEHMESEELAQQKRLGNEMMQLEEQLAQVRKENELLRIEYEQNVAANEQTGPINKEMRSLITSLQTNNKLLKSDNNRSKKRLDESLQECDRLKKQIAILQQNAFVGVKKEEIKNESTDLLTPIIKKECIELVKKEEDSTVTIQLKELKDHNKKLFELNKELKNQIENLKLNKPASPVMSNTNNKTNELDDAKREIKRLKEQLEKFKTTNKHVNTISNITSPTSASHSNSLYHNNEEQNIIGLCDYSKKIKSLEETIRELHKNLNSKKQEETALLNDMEITGQAFEDMQEQNVRLMQQLREKDDANFKLVSERIKLENVQKILKEEKEIYVQQVATIQGQLDTQMIVAKKLEEQFQAINQTVTLTEKEMIHLHQICDNYKRQSIDNIQLIQDLKLNTQKYLSQLKEVQQQIAEKSEALASQTFLNKRSQEEIKHLQSKLDRQKKFEMASSMDEVLMEEIKEYKEQLRCPSCKVKQKDAVLTKCFHVFCYDCLQKRLDTRQRKCPKCNAGFGVNDFRKLYLS